MCHLDFDFTSRWTYFWNCKFIFSRKKEANEIRIPMKFDIYRNYIYWNLHAWKIATVFVGKDQVSVQQYIITVTSRDPYGDKWNLDHFPRVRALQ